MGWLVLPFAALMVAMGLSVGSPSGALAALALGALTAPPLWSRVRAYGHETHPGWRWSAAIVAGFATLALNANAYSETPEGKAAHARREAAKQAADKQAAAEATASNAQEQQRIASGEHCLSSWDGSFPRLKEAVKRRLRNPRSFEHVETVRSPVDDQGTFGLIMTYRAENGFGGLNLEAIGVSVDAKNCNFERASNADLAARLRSRKN